MRAVQTGFRRKERNLTVTTVLQLRINHRKMTEIFPSSNSCICAFICLSVCGCACSHMIPKGLRCRRHIGVLCHAVSVSVHVCVCACVHVCSLVPWMWGSPCNSRLRKTRRATRRPMLSFELKGTVPPSRSRLMSDNCCRLSGVQITRQTWVILGIAIQARRNFAR